MKKKKKILKRKKYPVIALAQIKYFDIVKRHNIYKILKYIRLAKKKHADIICFPESCIHKSEILTFKHKLIKKIQEECRKNSIWAIITQEIFRKKFLRKKSYNTAILIDRNGKIVGEYRKIHLSGDTTKPGTKIKVFQTDFATIGIAICWDLAFPQMFKEMKRLGAEIVFCPSEWWYETRAHDKDHRIREQKLIKSMIQARAFENLFYVAVCNPVMESKYQVSYSGIASPHHIVEEIAGKEGLITARLNLSHIKKFHKIYD